MSTMTRKYTSRRESAVAQRNEVKKTAQTVEEKIFGRAVQRRAPASKRVIEQAMMNCFQTSRNPERLVKTPQGLYVVHQGKSEKKRPEAFTSRTTKTEPKRMILMILALHLSLNNKMAHNKV